MPEGGGVDIAKYLYVIIVNFNLLVNFYDSHRTSYLTNILKHVRFFGALRFYSDTDRRQMPWNDEFRKEEN